MIVQSCEEIVPSADKAHSVLIKYQLELLLHPAITDLRQEYFKGHFTLSDGKDLYNILLAIQGAVVPQQTDGELREGKADAQSREYGLPVPLLECLCLHIGQETLAGEILLDRVVQMSKGVVLSNTIGQCSQLNEDIIEALPNLAHCGSCPWRILEHT